MKKPKISVIYITWNRKNDILKYLPKLKKQTFTNFETILVDNNSTDGTSDVVVKKLPWVKLIKLSKNIARAAHNEGMKIAKADILVCLDSDIYLEKHALERIFNKFKKYKDLDAIAIKMIVPSTKVWHVSPYSVDGDEEVGYESLFGGGMIALKRKVFEKTKGFSKDFFVYVDEWEFLPRFWQYGFNMRYFPDIWGYHMESPYKFRSEKRGYYITRNWILFYFLYLPLNYFFKFFLRHTKAFTKATTSGAESPKGSFLGILGALVMIPKMLSKRKPMKGEVLSKFIKYYFPKKGDVVIEHWGWSMENKKHKVKTLD